jgi:hypothetical protein
MRIVPIVLLMALLPAAAWAAESGKTTYRWTDDKGRTHYSDVQAPKSEVVDVKPGSGVVKAVANTGDTAAKLQDCQRRKDQLATYNSADKVSETDALGNTRTYTAEEKIKLVARTQLQMEQACTAAKIAAPNNSDNNQ